MAVMKREWVTEYRGHKVRVVSSWFAGAKLYIDGECRDEDRSWIQVDKDHPCLSSRMEMEGGATVLVEAYITSILTTKCMICIEGVHVGGEVL